MLKANKGIRHVKQVHLCEELVHSACWALNSPLEIVSQ